jgi:hypothetical protein
MRIFGIFGGFAGFAHAGPSSDHLCPAPPPVPLSRTATVMQLGRVDYSYRVRALKRSGCNHPITLLIRATEALGDDPRLTQAPTRSPVADSDATP